MLNRVVRLIAIVIGLAALGAPGPACAGNTAITGELVWPSQNDLAGTGVGGAAGDGKKLLEVQWQKIAPALAGGNNFVLSGGTLPATDPDLTIQVAAGTAVIDGSYVQWPATNVTLPASSTSHLFLKLVRGSGLLTGAEIEDNTSGTIPASALKLGTATTSGSAVTATTDARIVGPGALEVWTSSGTYTVPAGQTRIKIRIYGAGGGEGGSGGGCEFGGPSDGSNGSGGGSGGTTSVGSLVSANGGAGGSGGGGFVVDGSRCENPGESTDGSHASTTASQVSLPGGGMMGGGHTTNGGDGGRGAYAESYVTVTPGASHTITIGAGGTGGAGGANASGGFGATGQAGQAGRILIEY